MYGGRWNSPGTAMVYTAGSQSLAALEMLVHLDTADLLGKYVVFEVTIVESLIRALAEEELPRNWRSDPPPAKLRKMGDAWVASAVCVALCVPSAIIPTEQNFLLNPKHPDFAKLQFGKAVPFHYDSRLADRK